MTTLDNLLAFESTLMDWMLTVKPAVLETHEVGVALLHERKRVYEAINQIVADRRAMAALERAGDEKLAALLDQLRGLEAAPAATDSALRAVRGFLSVVAAAIPSGSGEHVLVRRTSAA